MWHHPEQRSAWCWRHWSHSQPGRETAGYVVFLRQFILGFVDFSVLVGREMGRWSGLSRFVWSIEHLYSSAFFPFMWKRMWWSATLVIVKIVKTRLFVYFHFEICYLDCLTSLMNATFIAVTSDFWSFYRKKKPPLISDHWYLCMWFHVFWDTLMLLFLLNDILSSVNDKQINWVLSRVGVGAASCDIQSLVSCFCIRHEGSRSPVWKVVGRFSSYTAGMELDNSFIYLFIFILGLSSPEFRRGSWQLILLESGFGFETGP